jgi:hypothetical protein
MVTFGVGLFVASVAAVALGVPLDCAVGTCAGAWAVVGGGALSTLGVVVGAVGVFLDVRADE